VAVNERGSGGGAYRLGGPVRGARRRLDMTSVAVELPRLVYVDTFPN